MKIWGRLLLCLAAGLLLLCPLCAAQESKSEMLVYRDCGKCHQEKIQELGGRGAAHQEQLGCADCHLAHPKKGEKPQVAACADCHDPGSSKHFALADCTGCHHPHRPLDFDFSALKGARPVCLTCHPEAAKSEAGYANAHAELACNECHLSHRGLPSCTDCHDSHDASMAADDCRACHAPHQPLPIRYWAGVAKAWCAACHPQAVEVFEQQGAAHQRQVGCYRCHREHPPRPGSAPASCDSCHDPGKNRHFVLTDCRSCHQPHAPHGRSLDQMANLTAACLSCHPSIQEQVAASPESHGGMACHDCHQQHRQRPLCSDCHEPHAAAMTQPDCLRCHAPHAPGPVRFQADTPAALCAACHGEAVANLAAAGGAHGRQFGCADCHQGHPPQQGAIPNCADCHAPGDNAHFSLENCAGCHNPHAPLAQAWQGMERLASACASCHPEPPQAPATHPSPHAEMGCADCHQGHREVLSCLECHEPHGSAMSGKDCRACHAPHAPLAIDFASAPERKLCAACHHQPVEELAGEGGGHQAALNCFDCHAGHPAAGCRNCHAAHPQQGVGAAPACSECHAPAENSHFAFGGCRACHPAHQPLKVNLVGLDPVGPACLSCHTRVGQTFAARESAHRAMDCNECHPVHGESQACDQCHESHGPGMGAGDCRACHQPHAPNVLSYAADVPAALCGACHGEAVQTLATQGSAHQAKASCGTCHPEHKPDGRQTVVFCRSCHLRLQKRHYTVEPCLPCHTPHAPKQINLADLKVVKPLCVSCHNPVGRFMEFNPGGHSRLDCRKCHLEHRDHKQCLECHQPHGAEMTHDDCLLCHKPHTPAAIEYGWDLPGALCAPCHQDQVKTLETRGLAHKRKVKCVACHREHPPEGEATVADCVRCHEPGDKAHFAVGNCAGCHRGHAPREVDFGGVKQARAACVSCHPEPARAMQAAPSAHTRLDCGACHTGHRELQACTGCHRPHTAEMTGGDCGRCHAAHTPVQVSFPAGIPGSFCQGCHAEVAATLAGGGSRHRDLDCLKCHQGQHGAAIACDTCHGWPHESGLHKKYPDCLKCHGNPHDLVNWKKP
ncbi:c-type cytochrome [Desulfuromonas versatilis]|uniref:C-type cytochrome n=1 Tax=Desulfuromonas versatilis TaxID=2802975 RepID=A0ABM8HSN8_9BACT|nr:cytochrome c3 family protein [Desulfuromonas versatilis]BCR03474.1 c-type cytochrome [Desulfuromonas versatilis]